MGKKFIADGAPCMCKFGSAPGRLKVVSHQLIRINHSDKKIATSAELGNPFYPPHGLRVHVSRQLLNGTMYMTTCVSTDALIRCFPKVRVRVLHVEHRALIFSITDRSKS